MSKRYTVQDDEGNFRSLVIAPDGSTIARCNTRYYARLIVSLLNTQLF